MLSRNTGHACPNADRGNSTVSGREIASPGRPLTLASPKPSSPLANEAAPRGLESVGPSATTPGFPFCGRGVGKGLAPPSYRRLRANRAVDRNYHEGLDVVVPQRLVT